jgi:hypothetical protein
MSKEKGDYTNDYAIRGRIGGYVNASKNNPKEYTAKAREGFEKRFLDMVDKERLLPEEERQRRAEAAKKAYMNELARKSAQKRQK